MKKLIWIGFILFTMACTHTGFAPSITSKTYPVTKTADQIELFRSQLPTKHYIEIGSVNATGGSTEASVKRLKEKAAANGGEALIGLEPYSGGMAATVIRFTGAK